MAKRRRRGKLARALGGLAEGVAPVTQYMMRDALNEKSNARILDRQEQASERSQIFDVLKKVMANEIDPEQAAQLTGMDVSRFQPSAERVKAGIGSTIEGAKSLSELPTEAGVRQQVRRRRDMSDPVQGFTEQYDQAPEEGDNPQGVQTLDARSFGPRENPHTQSLVDQLKARTGHLQAQVPYEKVDSVDDRGLKVQRRVQQNKQGDLGVLPQEPSPEQTAQLESDTLTAGLNAGIPEQKGEAFRREEISGKLSPQVALAKADVDNMVERLTRTEKVRTAGAVSGAQRSASLAAENDPTAVAGSANRAGQIASAEAAARAPYVPKTEGETRAAGSIVQLVGAHAKLTDMENRGMRYPIAKEGLTTIPLIGSTIGTMAAKGLEGPAEEAVAQAANFFIDLFGYVRSGVTVRPDERSNFARSLTWLPGESNVTRMQKQQSRQAFIAAAQIQAQRGAREAGKALGQAIQDGILQPDVVQMLQFTNPEMIRGFAESGIDVSLEQSDGTVQPFQQALPGGAR